MTYSRNQLKRLSVPLILLCAAFCHAEEFTLEDVIGHQNAGLAELLDQKKSEYQFTGLTSRPPATFQSLGTVYLSADARRVTAKTQARDARSDALHWMEESYLFMQDHIYRNLRPNRIVDAQPVANGNGVVQGVYIRKAKTHNSPVFIEKWLTGIYEVSLEEMVSEHSKLRASIVVESAKKAIVTLSVPSRDPWVILNLDPSNHWWVTSTSLPNGRPITSVEYIGGLPSRLKRFNKSGGLETDTVLSGWKPAQPEDFEPVAIVGDDQMLREYPEVEGGRYVYYRKIDGALVADAQVTEMVNANNNKETGDVHPKPTTEPVVNPVVAPPVAAPMPAACRSFYTVGIASIGAGVAAVVAGVLIHTARARRIA